MGKPTQKIWITTPISIIFAEKGYRDAVQNSAKDKLLDQKTQARLATNKIAITFSN
jgi:hypothetical protein